MPATETVEDVRARVVESYGRRVIVQTVTGERRPAQVFGKRIEVVCGDHVILRSVAGSDQPLVTSVLPRQTLVSRTDNRGRTEPLAANATQLAVIIAPEPVPELFVADRYLAAAAYAGLRGIVIVNKTDLHSQGCASVGTEYVNAGLPVVHVSALHRSGVEELGELLRDRSTLLVGQSGVGKSTLCNAFVPEAMRPTRALSDSTGEGRHTTVAALLLPLPTGGEIMDSPGVRDYAPAPIAESRIQTGWPEINARAADCRFNDCLHLREPGCAVIAAVEAKELSARRYESYKRLVNLMRQLVPSHERPKF